MDSQSMPGDEPPAGKTDSLQVKSQRVKAGDSWIKRVVTAEKGGVLRQEFKIGHGDDVLAGSPWQFDTHGSADWHLSTLDGHWKALGPEFKEIMEQAHFYYHVKNRGGPIDEQILIRQLLNQLNTHLFSPVVSDEDAAIGEFDTEGMLPIVTVSGRLRCFRLTLEGTDMKLDPFERQIMELQNRIGRATAIFDDVTTGEGYDGLQLTAGGSEDEDLDIAAYEDDEDEREPVWTAPEDDDGWKEVDDPDDERDDRLDELVTEYNDYIVDFTDAANRLWTDAVTRVYENKKPVKNKTEIHNMCESMAKAHAIYEKIREVTDGMAVSDYELKPAFSLIEDPSKGIVPRMERLIRMASNPDRLAIMIASYITEERSGPEGRGV